MKEVKEKIVSDSEVRFCFATIDEQQCFKIMGKRGKAVTGLEILRAIVSGLDWLAESSAGTETEGAYKFAVAGLKSLLVCDDCCEEDESGEY